MRLSKCYQLVEAEPAFRRFKYEIDFDANRDENSHHCQPLIRQNERPGQASFIWAFYFVVGTQCYIMKQPSLRQTKWRGVMKLNDVLGQFGADNGRSVRSGTAQSGVFQEDRWSEQSGVLWLMLNSVIGMRYSSAAMSSEQKSYRSHIGVVIRGHHVGRKRIRR